MAFRIIEHTISSIRGCKKPLETKDMLFCDRNRAERRVSWLRREFGSENIAFSMLKGQPEAALVYVRVN